MAKAVCWLFVFAALPNMIGVAPDPELCRTFGASYHPPLSNGGVRGDVNKGEKVWLIAEYDKKDWSIL